MRTVALLVGAGLLAACGWVFPGGAAGQTSAVPDPAVFELLTMTEEAGQDHSIAAGTAFFIDQDGTALTNSHVVYLAGHDPGRYRLLAIVGREFYGAAVVCASALPEAPPEPGALVTIGRDVAEVRLTPSAFRFQKLAFLHSDVTFTAHVSALPGFSARTLGADPKVGDLVRIVGYGVAAGHHEEPVEQWSAPGTVSRLENAPDGTPVFRFVSGNRPGEGGSGSPVLAGDGLVVGIYTWGGSAFGAAISSSVLRRVCV